VFFVVPRIAMIDPVMEVLSENLPELRVLIAHGQMRNGKNKSLRAENEEEDSDNDGDGEFVPPPSNSLSTELSEMEANLVKFASGEADVLLATTVIENGVDIPTVNTIIVASSEYFGLSTLYQLRGRVGRSDTQAHAYFLTGSPASIMNKDGLSMPGTSDFPELFDKNYKKSSVLEADENTLISEQVREKKTMN